MKSKNGLIFGLFLTIVLTISCRKDMSRIDAALISSENNRLELEKVLTHFSRNRQDSLKLKASQYLIENMPGHISLSGKLFAHYQDEIRDLLDKGASEDQLFEAIEKFQSRKDITIGDVMKEDAKVVSADRLIKNIDRAFDAWQSKPWSRHLNFEEFCEYILPYKYAEYQVLDDWRDTLSQKFSTEINKIFLNDETRHSAYHAGKLINREINDNLQIKLDGGRVELSPFLRADLIHKIPFGSCGDYTALILAAMRSHGVPASIDYIPQWGHRNGGNHKWITVLNNNGKHLPIPHLHQNPGDVFFPMHILPKIYRQTYAPTPDRMEYTTKASYIFMPLTQFHKDVTSEYTTTSDISIPIRNKGIANDYAFIACSSFRTWKVVDFGKIKKNTACFRQMGRNVVYLIFGYNGERLIPVSEPFILSKDGHIRYVTPDYKKNREITLWRKYPKAESTAHVESRMIGGKIQATNDPDRKKWETLYEIQTPEYPDRILTGTDTKYRYWRFVGRKWAYMNIAEFQLLKDDSEVCAVGKALGSDGMLNNDSTYSHSKAFDGDWLTYYHSPEPSEESWVGLDLGAPEAIKFARCVARSDDNGIHFGDTYELSYWQAGEWKSLGRQTATERFLTFCSVPDNALLLLMNLTRGREERIFTYEDGEQIWW